MKSNFDKVVCRRGTNSFKWDTISENFGIKDGIPLWVADMDFEVDENIVNGIKKRLDHAIFGYGITPQSYYDVFISWMKNEHNYTINKDWIVFSPGVVPGISYIIDALTEVGDEVIVQSPVYHQFYSIIENNNRVVVDNPLVLKDGKYKMDLDDLEKKITPKTKIILLCSPHNPVGRVWETDELSKLGELCLKHNIIVVSDEIHCDIVYKGYKHTVFSTIDKRFKEISIICTAPNKTFNIAGFKTANIVVENTKLREKLVKNMEKLFIYGHTVLGTIAQEEAYANGKQWYDELMEYLEENKCFVVEYIENRIPKLKVIKPEGTYLLWIDFSKLNLEDDELSDFLVKTCNVLLNDGKEFGDRYSQYRRLNIATQRSVLRAALEKIENEINKLEENVLGVD